MMRVIREEEYKTCDKCGHREFVRDGAVGCDNCGKELDLSKPEIEYIDATVHRHNGEETEPLYFCSWKCCLITLKKVKTDYFISLPFLSFDNKKRGLEASDFFKLLKL